MHIGKRIEALVQAYNKESMVVFLARLCYTEAYLKKVYRQETVSEDVLRNFADVLNVPLEAFFQPNENDTELQLNSKKNYNKVENSQEVLIANEGSISVAERELYERLIEQLETQLAEKNEEIVFLRSLLNNSNLNKILFTP